MHTDPKYLNLHHRRLRELADLAKNLVWSLDDDGAGSRQLELALRLSRSLDDCEWNLHLLLLAEAA